MNQSLRTSAIIIVCLASILIADHYYFKNERSNYNGGSISEGFVRKGSLGKILREKGLLSVSDETQEIAADGMCATDGELKGFDYHNQMRLRLKIASHRHVNALIRVRMPKAEDESLRTQDSYFTLDPKRYFYSHVFTAQPDTPIVISVNTHDKLANSIVMGVYLDGRFGRTQTLLEGGNLNSGHIVNAANKLLTSNSKVIQTLSIDADNPRIILQIPKGVPETMFKGVFPGKKNHGFCNYSANTITAQAAQPHTYLPNVNLNVSGENLNGPNGLLTNRRKNGRLTEVPADVTIMSSNEVYQQRVGLRFHGGTPARKKDVYSYRIYARKDYGKGSIPHSAIFGATRDKDLRTVVFKYTYQAFFERTHYYFNPFYHALAFDIGTEIGAIVPSHGLVQLAINGRDQGVFLAMEHLSDRTVENWLGHQDFVTVTYKKDNALEDKYLVSRYMKKIQNHSGEASFKALEEHYNIENVINSILLSAYIGDDDFCQGMEVLDTKSEQIITINWDLDHGFLKWREKTKDLIVNSDYMGFEILRPERSHLCSRSRVYSWVYSQSAQFRTLFRERLTFLLENQLSANHIKQLLKHYREVNEHYYQGTKLYAIEDLERYAEQRPAKLIKELNELEGRYQNKLTNTRVGKSKP